MTALKVLQLVDSEGHPQPVLEELVYAEGARRRDLLRGLLEDYYRPVFALDLSRATRNQFHEAFRTFGAREGVLAKCEAFFIKAADAAGIKLSPYILAGRHQGRRKSGAKGLRAARGAAAQPTGAQPDAPVTPADSQAPDPSTAPESATSDQPSPAPTKLSVAQMMAETIRRMSQGESVSSLYVD